MKTQKFFTKQIILYINFHLCLYRFDTSLLKVNYFKQNTKLYYVNAMNNDKGDLYFEFWGEIDKNRYIIAINSTTKEQINFGDKNFFQIDASSSSSFYHESIIIDNNDEYNIFSINKENFDFINIKKQEFSTETVKNIFGFEVKEQPGFKNCIIKLKNNNYLLSMILQRSTLTVKYHKFISRIF